MARKINGSQSVQKTSHVPTQDELEEIFKTCLTPEIRKLFFNQPISKLIPSLQKLLIDSSSYYNKGEFENSQLIASRTVVLAKEVLQRNMNNKELLEPIKDLISRSLRILEDLKQLSIKYHTSNSDLDDPCEQSNDYSNNFTIKNAIKPIDLLDLVKNNKKILLVDYRGDSNSYLSIPQYSNLETVQLCPMVLAKYLSYNELCNKFPVDYQEKLKKSFYDFIILMGDKTEDDNEKDIREEILIKGFTEIKNISRNQCFLPVLPLQGGFRDFVLHYPNYVKKTDNLYSSFSYHQKFLEFLDNHRTESIKNIQEYPRLGKSVPQNKSDMKIKKESLDETKENNSSLIKKLIEADMIVPQAPMPVNYHSPISKPIPQPRGQIKTPDIKYEPELTPQTIYNICDSLDQLNTTVEKPIIPDKSTKPQIMGPKIPNRDLKENIVKKRKFFDDRIIEIYSYSLKDLQRRSTEGGVSLGMTGLVNLGNTCFMNSVLQALFHLPEMRNLFTIDNVIKYINENNKFGTQGSITAVFTSLMDLFWTGKYRKIHPECFLVTFANQVNRRLADRCQQDAQEFQIYLLDALHEDINYISIRKSFRQNYNGTNLFEDFNDYKKKVEQFSHSKVNSLFNLRTVSTVVCSECMYQSVTFEDSVQISVELPIQPQSTKLSECLSNHFSVETLNDGWKCPKCDTIRKSTKTQRIWELPEILVIHKKRFAYVSGCCDKNNVFVDFDINNFNVSSFVHEENVKNVRYLYDLYAVVNHMGTLNSGHYTSFVRSNDQWFECDDETVRHLNDYNQDIKTKTAFMLYYRLKK
ncbi:Ubiquitin carboxyl-terminal hydrolase 21 [Strongyloides ratti]|uniref:Ubiquitin carboxyl-terminal hydrolase n=1 Tax=Strongyloides ratti TaxID=34506 RepID=A0A090LF61_STRRB|nr:Ubiquitin carboxyl-terminal hydrolase 21 [Strongyloides ratti]CEF68436.1 Ubiquitin carboxyl-terminal hydrolase 21 [Strongyloides ratti]